MKAIITAGGRGTRMQPLTFSSNKQLIPLANKPLIFYPIEAVVALGIKEIGVNYGPGQLEELKAVLGNGRQWGVKFTYILQEEPLGLADIIRVAKPFLGKGKFLMHLGDNIFYGEVKPLYDYFLKEKLNALAPVIHHPENARMGVPYFDKKGRLKRYVEKPKHPPHDLAVPGLYFFDDQVFGCLQGKEKIKPSKRGELEIGSCYEWLVEHGHKVGTMEFKGVWLDPGKFDDWLETNQFLLDKEIENNSDRRLGRDVKVEGRVKIGKNCKIKGSFLRGPSIIGERVVIENSFIGPYSSIADDCQIRDAKLENVILMKDVQVVSPGKSLDSCLIGEESAIKGNRGNSNGIELFVGNKCVMKL
jgi:glucose-1-phosphate thymidylyltransferase